MEEDEDDDDGDENEDSDEGSEAESYYLGFNTREEMDAFLKGKKLG
jgi:hypothetical protein